MKNKLKALALVASILSAPTLAASHTYIFGDSLSSPTGCEWAKQLPGAVHNYAQAGLTLMAMDMPNHLNLRPDNSVVIYIGGNDAGSGVPVNDFKARLKETINTVRSRGAETVYVVQLPDLNFPNFPAYRVAIPQVAASKNATFLDPGWGASSTVDGLHPSCTSHVYLGLWIDSQIN
jgi:hypothetical protein